MRGLIATTALAVAVITLGCILLLLKFPLGTGMTPGPVPEVTDYQLPTLNSEED